MTRTKAYYVGPVETRPADGLIQLHPRLPKTARGANGTLEIPMVNACEYIEDAPCPRVASTTPRPLVK